MTKQSWAKHLFPYQSRGHFLAVKYCMFFLGEVMVEATERKEEKENHILQLLLKVCGMAGRNESPPFPHPSINSICCCKAGLSNLNQQRAAHLSAGS